MDRKVSSPGLSQLQKMDLHCVFCGAQNDSTRGGYFKGKFLCMQCNNQIRSLDYYLGLGGD